MQVERIEDGERSKSLRSEVITNFHSFIDEAKSLIAEQDEIYSE